MWLDLAREFTERWVHQQQIREALGKTTLSEPRFMRPVLDTFMRALPRAYSRVRAPQGATVHVEVMGDAGGLWAVRYGPRRWYLVEPVERADATVRMPEDTAWRLLTRLVSVNEARESIEIEGSLELGKPAARAVAVMTTKL